jgi:hypothetical protein
MNPHWRTIEMDLQTVIKALTEKANMAVDNAGYHEERMNHHAKRMDEFRSQASRFHMAIDTLHEALDEPEPQSSLLDKFVNGEVEFVGAPFQVEPGVVLENHVAEDVPVDPATFPVSLAPPSSASGNGAPVYDLSHIIHGLRRRHIRYPVKNCHRNVMQFYRQTLISYAVDHPEYKTYLEAGGVDINGIYDRTWKNILKAADLLGLDKDVIFAETRALHHMIFALGTEGIDYHPIVAEEVPA